MLKSEPNYYDVWFQSFAKSLLSEQALVNDASKLALASFAEYGRGAVVYDCSSIFHKWLRSQMTVGEKTSFSVAYGLLQNHEQWLKDQQPEILTALNTYEPSREFLLLFTSSMYNSRESLVFEVVPF